MKKFITKNKMISIVVMLLLVVVSAIVILNLNWARTLLSFTQVDEYPLYSMKYYGDYHVEYAIPDPRGESANISETSNDFDMMCSSFLAHNDKGDPIFCRNLDYTLFNHPITVLFTDAPGKNASMVMADLFYLGYSKSNLPVKSLFKSRNLLNAPRIPIDGVNEYGLSLAILSVPAAEAPYDPGKQTTDEVGINRLILDNAKTVEEAIEVMDEYNILFHEGAAHFMIADSGGNSAVVEFIDGKKEIVRNEKPWQVCTNFVLSEDLYQKTGKDRYDLAEKTLSDKNSVLTEKEALELLSAISQSGTVWSVVYNLKTGKADIVMGRNYDKVNTFDLKMNDE